MTHSSGSLGTSGRDLYTEVGSGNEHLGDGDTVVRDKSHSKQVANIRIIVDHLADVDNQPDDQLGDVITRSRFTRKDECPRLHLFPLFRTGLLDSEVSVDDGENVERLSLVLVKTLDLAGKDRVEVDRNAQLGLEDFGKSSLVVLLDGSECLPKLGIVGHGKQVGKKFRVEQPLVAAQGMGDKSSQLGVAL